MKKNNWVFVILLLIISFYMPIKVNALSGSINIHCNSTTVNVGDTFSCTIRGRTDGYISDLLANVSNNNVATVTQLKTSPIWKANTGLPNINLHTTENKNGAFEVGTIYFRARKAGTLKVVISGVTFKDTSGNVANVSSVSASVKINGNDPEPEPEPPKSNDADLKSLAIGETTFSFDPDTTEYNLEVSSSVNSINILAVPSSSKAKVAIPSNLTLKDGMNNFNVVVTAEDGTTKTYKLNINRLGKILSDNCLLQNLTIEGHKINFDSGNFKYNVGNIKNSELVIKAVPEDDKAKVIIHGADTIGSDGVVVIEVTAESGKVQDYFVYANNVNALEKPVDHTFELLVASVLFVLSASLVLFLLLTRKTRLRVTKLIKPKTVITLRRDEKKMANILAELEKAGNETEKLIKQNEIANMEITRLKEELAKRAKFGDGSDSGPVENLEETQKQIEKEVTEEVESHDMTTIYNPDGTDVYNTTEDEEEEHLSEDAKALRKQIEDAKGISADEVNKAVTIEPDAPVVDEKPKPAPVNPSQVTAISADIVSTVVKRREKKQPKKEEIEDKKDKKDKKKIKK